MTDLTQASRDAIEMMVKVLMGTVAAKENVSCKQLMMVLYCLRSGGMRTVDLARELDCDSASISRCFNGKNGLGPAGSGCLTKADDGRIQVENHVIEAFNTIHKKDPKQA